MKDSIIEQYRSFLKNGIRTTIDFSQTDQSRGIPAPPIEKPFDDDAVRIDLTPRNAAWAAVRDIPLIEAIQNRKSHRMFRNEQMTIEELSFLLWATQGIRYRINANHAFRTVPSAGCRHALETYLCVINIAGMEQGLYRYLPAEHQLLLEYTDDRMDQKIVAASYGQRFLGQAAVTFIWTAIPYRMEWRYDRAAHKIIAIDAGHVCQNLYLACEAIGAGTCAIAAYNQDDMDRLVNLDGKEEFVIYLAPVGKPKT